MYKLLALPVVMVLLAAGCEFSLELETRSETEPEERDTIEKQAYVQGYTELAMENTARLDAASRSARADRASRSILKEEIRRGNQAVVDERRRVRKEAEAERRRADEESRSVGGTGLGVTPNETQSTGTATTSVWNRVAQCESGGNWSINTGNGYYGGLQFALSSWQWVGGSGYPHQASKAEQIKRAEILLQRQGWNAWPACSRKLGLR